MDEEELKDMFLGEEDDDVFEEEYPIFKCPNPKCGFIYDSKNPPLDFKGRPIKLSDYVVLSDPSKIQCPMCGCRNKFIIISREEYEKILKDKEKKQDPHEKEKENKRQRAMRYNNKEYNRALKKMNKELKEELLEKQRDPKRFAKYYYMMSFRLAEKYKNKLDLDMMQVRTNSMKISDELLKLYKYNEKSEDLLESLDERIEDDELYVESLRKNVEEAKEFSEEDSDLEYEHYEYVNNYNEKYGEEILRDKERELRIEKIRRESKEEVENEKNRDKEKAIDKKIKDTIDKYNKSIEDKK